MTDFFFLIKYLESTFPDFTPIYIIADFVKSIPLVDEIMGKNTIFIQRKYSEDEKLLKNKLYEFSKKNEKYILIIFPEGKIFTGEAIKKSNEWTLKKNEKMFNRVLYPRYKGIKIVLDYFKPNNIINLDLVYPDDILNTKGKRHRDFLIDNLPHQCFIRGTDITDLFKLNEDLEKILLHIWRKKDEFLTNYYQNKYEKQIKN
jgi:1-acyl-sn-glycerol-3-phosphate acyltransferase